MSMTSRHRAQVNGNWPQPTRWQRKHGLDTPRKVLAFRSGSKNAIEPATGKIFSIANLDKPTQLGHFEQKRRVARALAGLPDMEREPLSTSVTPHGKKSLIKKAIRFMWNVNAQGENR